MTEYFTSALQNRSRNSLKHAHREESLLEKMKGIMKAEGVLRLLSMVLLVLTVLIVGLDRQSTLLFNSFYKTASFKDMVVLKVLVIMQSVAAGYNLIQLVAFLVFSHLKANSNGVALQFGWYCFFLDQVVTYLSLAANSAATQASILAITGSSELQWLKLCSTYTRFCIQIGGGLVCGFTATFFMVIITSISAFKLFGLYSSKDFLVLKPTQRTRNTTSSM